MRKATPILLTSLMLLAASLAMRPSAQAQAQQGEDVRALLQGVSKNIGADNLNA